MLDVYMRMTKPRRQFIKSKRAACVAKIHRFVYIFVYVCVNVARPTKGKMAANARPNLHICVYLCAYICVNMMHIHPYDNIKTKSTKGGICIYIYAHVYLYTYVCKTKCIHMCTYVCIHMRVNIAVCAQGKMAASEKKMCSELWHLYIRVFIYTYVIYVTHIYTHMYVYTCVLYVTHIYTHTYMGSVCIYV